MHKTYLAISLTLLIFNLSFAQRVQDFEIWHSISFSKELSKSVSFDINPQVRLDENASQLKNHIMSFALGYKPVKWFQVSPSFRYTFRNSANAVRFFVDNSFRLPLGKSDFQFNCRIRLQTDKIMDSRRARTYTARIRPQIVYKPSKLKDFSFTLASFEAFFSDRTGVFQYYRFRASAGLSYEINKHTEIGLNYITQLQPFTIGSQLDHIAQMTFQMNFERSKKADKDKKKGKDKKKDKDKNKDGGKKDKKDKKDEAEPQKDPNGNLD